MSEDAHSRLQRNLAELSTLIISDQGIIDTLTRVAHLAVESITPAQFAGITMMVDGRVSTQAFTDPTSPQIDQAQYDSGRGPCLDAFRQGSVVVADLLDRDDRWPEFAAAAVEHGVRSTLSLPLIAGDNSVGALNLYSKDSHAFDEKDAETGQLYAAQAAVLLLNAQAYWGARTQSEHLQTALAGREPIDMAKGIIMNAMGCDPEEAFSVLAKQSQLENRKLREVAEEIVARARRS
jgi:GAF domain-containing protein